LSDVAGGTHWSDDVIESGKVGRREVRIVALTLLYHVALITSLLTRLLCKVSSFVTGENARTKNFLRLTNVVYGSFPRIKLLSKHLKRTVGSVGAETTMKISFCHHHRQGTNIAN